MTDATKLELSFTAKHISYFAHTSCRSFVKKQPGRFRPHHSSVENEKLMGSGWLHWPEKDLYLYALIMQHFFIARGYPASVLIDERGEDKAEWVVWTTDPLDGEPESEVNFTTNSRILRLPAVQALTGLGRSTVYEQMAAGRFPKGIKLGERAVGWLEADIQNWIETKVLESKHD